MMEEGTARIDEAARAAGRLERALRALSARKARKAGLTDAIYAVHNAEADVQSTMAEIGGELPDVIGEEEG